MLIIEIILTIFAWKRGWRWLAILPVAIAFFIGFMIGLSGGAADSSVIWIDILAVIALIFMVAIPKVNLPDEPNGPSEPTEPTV